MSETANVRVVRCPKCENLLPEVTDSSVYQCGGCGAVLKAKNKGVDLDTFSEKFEEEKTQASIDKLSDRYEQMMNISERQMMDPSDGSESDVRSTISSSGRANRPRPRPISRNRPKAAHDFDEFEIYHESYNGPRNADRNELDGFRRAQRIESEDMRYIKEGPSSLVSKFGYDYENPARNEVDYVGQDDRAELLKKLDELTDQLNRSGNLTNKGKEKAHLDRRTGRQDPYASDGWYSDASSEMNNRVPMRNPYRDPPYQMHRQEMGCDGFYPPRYAPNHAPMYRRGPQQAPTPYHAPPLHGYKSGLMDDGMMYMDAMEPYPPHFSRHHHHPSNFSDNLSRFGSRDYNNPRFFPDPGPLKPHNAQSSHTRWPGDMSLEADNYIRPRRPTRARLASGGKKCRPIAGGAPFVSCYNCFELLLLPKKIRTNGNCKKNKISCGACSTVIVFTVPYNKLVVSSDVEPEENNINNHNNHVKVGKSMSTYTSEAEEDNISLTAGASKDEKGPRPSVGWSLQDHLEYSNIYRKADHFEEGSVSGRSEKHEKVIIPNKNAAVKQILRNESSATEIDLSSNEYSNTGTTFDSGEASREGDRLKASNAAKSFFGGIGFNDSNRSDENLESDKANVTVNGHLIAARLVKKAEKLAGPIQPGNYWYDFRAGFWGAIGGPCLGIIPSDDNFDPFVIFDARAVIFVQPFIEEFNYPMPEHCAGGNTHVFINGRELNQKDLNLLGNRGLPTERDRSYILEISGRVLDEYTGEELESLGKLAPTVERVKHGFGMRAPKPVFLQFSPAEVSDNYTAQNGDWVQDFDGPIYTNTTCNTIEAPQNCMKNGRPDSDYVYWRWKPTDCGLPKLDPKKFLKIMGDKSLAFVGDSIMRNHVQSLLCILSQVEQAVEIYHDEPYKNRRWTFPSHNFTVSVVWAPFLTKASTFEDDNGVSSGLIQLHLDEPDTKWTKQYKNFDFIVIGGGKWFLKSAIYYENNTIVGCHNCNDMNITELGFVNAYRKALNSTLKLISRSNHKAHVFFRTTTPDHFENGEWNTGGYCNRTRPFKEGEIEIDEIDEMMRNVELEEFENAAAAGLGLRLFDTTLLSLLRPDGHPGVYRKFYPYDWKDKNAKIQYDCLHWCLPGPIDSWNDIMMEMLLRYPRK
ncbi:protein trichome birefringence-like 25 [Phtheirospermum japonicum]|uniref:Protein trichome birefringence-like 25 n=1 Tax=Phtheirospermum japonicum TaxID=374723 RepID=A0A830C191_9LAMI|nr:protein trichome birefringence-like 25 [Phtheirospermum japonicum]